MACCKWLGNSRDKYCNPLSSGLRGGEVRGPTLLAVPWHCRYCCCGGCERVAVLGHSNPPPQGWEKTVPGCLLGRSRGRWESAETSRSENKTCLVAGRPLWWVAAGLATTPVLGGLPRRRMPGLSHWLRWPRSKSRFWWWKTRPCSAGWCRGLCKGRCRGGMNF